MTSTKLKRKADGDLKEDETASKRPKLEGVMFVTDGLPESPH